MEWPLFTAEQQDEVPLWWSSLSAAEPLFSDPRWLELFARSRSESPAWWFSAGRSDQAEIGLRATVVQAGARKSMNPYRWLFEPTAYHDGPPFDPAGAPAREAWFPLLLCSYPGLDSYPVGAGRDPGLVQLLLDGVADWAASQGIAVVALGFVQPERHEVATAAAAAGYHGVPVAVRANLPLSAGPAAAGSSARQRGGVRRLRRRLAERGVRVREVDHPLAELDALVQLRCAHARQHGKEPDPAEERSWLGPLLERLADRITVYGAYAGDELRGFSLFVDDGHWWHAFAVARRDPAADRDLYFELMYHLPVEQAAARGITELSFGYGTSEAKRRRGCTLVPVPAWYRAAQPQIQDWLAGQTSQARVTPARMPS